MLGDTRPPTRGGYQGDLTYHRRTPASSRSTGSPSMLTPHPSAVPRDGSLRMDPRIRPWVHGVRWGVDALASSVTLTVAGAHTSCTHRAQCRRLVLSMTLNCLLVAALALTGGGPAVPRGSSRVGWFDKVPSITPVFPLFRWVADLASAGRRPRDLG